MMGYLMINTHKLGLYEELGQGQYLFEGRVYEATGEVRPPRAGEFFLASPIMIIKQAEVDYAGQYNHYKIVKLLED